MTLETHRSIPEILPRGGKTLRNAADRENDSSPAATCPNCGNAAHRLISIQWNAEGGHATCWACRWRWDVPRR